MAQACVLNEDGLVLSAGYADTMEQVVLPYLSAHRETAYITGEGNCRLYCERYRADAPRGTVVIVHGFTSTTYKFSEIIHSLLRSRFSVLAYDQRGHGRSGRDETIKDLSLTHVDRFEDYVLDLKRVCDALLESMPRPHLVFCHSMGGAVTGLFLERFPGVFARAVFCSPMIAVDRHGIPMGLSKLICQTAFRLGKRKQRFLMSQPYAGPEDFATSSANGRERFDWYDAAKAADPLLQNNGPTFGWTMESLRVTGQLLAPGAVEKISIPVRVYGAEQENLVLPQAQRTFASRVPGGSYTLIQGARHEIYRSTDAILFPWWHSILLWYAEEHIPA